MPSWGASITATERELLSGSQEGEVTPTYRRPFDMIFQRAKTIKINFSTVFAGQAVGIKEVHDDIWLVSFMDYD
jgi:hypothetical protein